MAWRTDVHSLTTCIILLSRHIGCLIIYTRAKNILYAKIAAHNPQTTPPPANRMNVPDGIQVKTGYKNGGRYGRLTNQTDFCVMHENGHWYTESSFREYYQRLPGFQRYCHDMSGDPEDRIPETQFIDLLYNG